jgi:CrcB protein
MRRQDLPLVAVGGFLGAVSRYGVGLAVGALAPAAAGTLAVNVLGSFALGALVVVAPRPRTQLLVGTGFLSSFTTYSTFAVETAGMSPTWAAANVGGTYALGVLGALAGRLVGERLW